MKRLLLGFIATAISPLLHASTVTSYAVTEDGLAAYNISVYRDYGDYHGDEYAIYKGNAYPIEWFVGKIPALEEIPSPHTGIIPVVCNQHWCFSASETRELVGLSKTFVDSLSTNDQRANSTETPAVSISTDTSIEEQANNESIIDQDAMLIALDHFNSLEQEKENKENEQIKFNTLVKELLIDPFLQEKNIVTVRHVGKLLPVNINNLSPESPVFKELEYQKERKEYQKEIKKYQKEIKESPEKYPFELTLEVTLSDNYINNIEHILKYISIPISSPNAHKVKVRHTDISQEHHLEELFFYLDRDKYDYIRQHFDTIYISETLRNPEQERYELVQGLQRVIGQYSYILIELLDSNNNVFLKKQLRYDQLLNISDYESAFPDFYTATPTWYFDDLSYSSGSKNTRKFIYLTKNEVLRLKNIRVSTSSFDQLSWW